MTVFNNAQSAVIRNSRGLCVAGTRITLYNIMDHLKAGWPPELIRDWFNLTDKQINDVLEYIEIHRPEFEAEYELVLKHAEEARQYWEERNRQHFAEALKRPVKPGEEKIRDRLRERQAKWGQAPLPS